MNLYDNAYLIEFEANIEASGSDARGAYVLLDTSAFFAEGGGQSSDSGTIGDAVCACVHTVDGEKRHYVDKIPDSTKVNCKIDFDKRFRRMQNHSGEHIVSGIVHKMFGFDNVGFHLGEDDVTCDFSGELSRENLSEIEIAANKIVFENRKINIFYPSKEELENMTYRSKTELSGDVRIVEIDGVDKCACCAPHVSRTGEIGLIKILNPMKWKGGVRIHLKCGGDALSDYAWKYEQAAQISALLSIKQNELFAGVSKLYSESLEKDKIISALRGEKIARTIESIKNSDRNIVIFEYDADMDGLRKIVNAGADKCAGVCAAFSGGPESFLFALKSANKNAKTVLVR
ncbi:MAG: alanyl-tRNA editing protein, partial [Clostridiales bacterium]|nr:alanyl-tRNA editing protein [Clostridiales bacterium]